MAALPARRCPGLRRGPGPPGDLRGLMASDEHDRSGLGGTLSAMPALARLAASAWWHAAERGAGLTLRLGSRVARTALGNQVEPPEHDRGEAPAPRRRPPAASRSALRR